MNVHVLTGIFGLMVGPQWRVWAIRARNVTESQLYALDQGFHHGEERRAQRQLGAGAGDEP